jgi:ABC-type nitrate/sulfonate/bicarbonate transport system substrate-binding protein
MTHIMIASRRSFLLGAAGIVAVPSLARAAPSINMLHLGAVGLTSLMLHLANCQGIFAKHDLNIQLVPVTGTQIPDSTDDNPVGHIGAPAAMIKASRGSDIRILASFDSGRLLSHLVVAPAVRSPQDLKGKRVGARVKGAALWIHTVLALEKLGLDSTRDGIEILSIGDPSKIVQALEAGQIEGAVLATAYSKDLVAKGYSVLLDLSTSGVYGAQDALVVTNKFSRINQLETEGIVAALIEAAAFSTFPKNHSAVVETMKTQLGVSDAAAEEGLSELSKILVRKPYASVERLLNMQRVMTAVDPKAAALDVAQLIDNRFVRKLDQEGFIDQIYAT